jgi:competence protein ComEC
LKIENSKLMKRRWIIFFSCWSFALGIAIASFLPQRFLLFDIYFFAIAIIFGLVAFLIPSKKRGGAVLCDGVCRVKNQSNFKRVVLLLLAFLFLGIWRLAISFPDNSPDKIWYYNGENLEITGIVASEPVNKEKTQRLEINVLNINPPLERGVPVLGRGVSSVTNKAVSGSILVSVPIYPEYFYSDVIKFQCEIKSPGVIEDFDYGRYLAAKNIYSVCYSPKLILSYKEGVEKGVGLNIKKSLPLEFIWRPIFSLRKFFRSTIELGLKEPEAGLVKAFILGDSTAIPDELNNSFRQSGLSHIVAISGTHITLMVGMFFFLLLGINLKRRQAFYLSIPLIIFYITLAGSPASAVRSGVMGFLVLLALHVGRLNRLDYSLVLSGAVMLLVNPKYLIADAGFQLSFLAVLSMAYLYPFFDNRLKPFYEKAPKKIRGVVKVICQAFALTIAAQIFTLPILIFSFRQISFIAPFSNILVLWISPFLMGGAFIGIGLSLLIPVVAPFFFLPTGLVAKYLIAVAEICATLPFAYWKF